MTLFEVAKYLIDDSKVSDDKINALLEIEGYNPTDEWDGVKSYCKLANALAVQVLKSDANSIRSFSEGGASVSYRDSTAFTKAKIDDIAAKLNCSSLNDKFSGKPKITDRSAFLDR